jgi:hypothetical protein
MSSADLDYAAGARRSMVLRELDECYAEWLELERATAVLGNDELSARVERIRLRIVHARELCERE